MKSRSVHRKTKILLNKTMIQATFLYGSETWTLSQKATEKLNKIERKILRQIFGPVNENGV